MRFPAQAIRIAALTAVLGALASAATASAIPRTADHWQDADHLSPSTQFVVGNSDATVQTDEPLTHTGSWCQIGESEIIMRNTRWWYVTGTGGPITVSTTGSVNGGAEFDTVLAVYKGNAPTGGNLVGCSDDFGGTDDGRVVIPSSEPGARYLVQAGGCGWYWNPTPQTWTACPKSGVGGIAITAVTNDQRAHAEPAAAGARANIGASTESGEVTTCNGARYGSTVWFRWTAPAPGWVTATASRFDTVVSIYRGADAQATACSDGARPEDPLFERVRTYVQPGDYFIQVGGKNFDTYNAEENFTFDVAFEEDLDLDRDGSRRPEDCNDASAAVRPGRADVAHNGIDEDCVGGDNKDGDGDGHTAIAAGGDDCDDRNLHINPGVADRPNNGVDEDCRGGDAPARLRSAPQVSLLNNTAPGGRIFGKLRVRDLRRNFRVVVQCRGSRACPKRAVKTAKGREVTFPAYFGKILKRGARVEIFVTTRGNVIGFYKRYTVSGSGTPAQRVCDLHPRAPRRPVRCR